MQGQASLGLLGPGLAILNPAQADARPFPFTAMTIAGLAGARAAGSPLGLRIFWPGGWLLAASLLHGELPEVRLELLPAFRRCGHGN